MLSAEMLNGAANVTEIEQFLYHEARLIDERRFEPWLELFTDDCCYWLPCNTSECDPAVSVSLIYDNKAHLVERVYRSTRGAGWAQTPPSTTMHMINNVMAAAADEGGTRVQSMQLIAEYRRGSEQFYAANVEHRLVEDGGSFQIAFKKITLLRIDEPISNLTFIL